MALKRGWVLLLILQLLNIVSSKGYHPEISALHERMSQNEHEWYFGVPLTSQVPEYEVVSPFLSDEEGLFKSYQLLPTRDRSWHYIVPLKDAVLLLSVSPSNEMVLETISIETHHKNGSITNGSHPEMSLCVGHVISYPGSSVAMSNHNGLDGIIQTEHFSLFIRPLSRRLMKGMRRNTDEHLHVVTKIKREKRDLTDTFEDELMKQRGAHETSKRLAKHKYLEMTIVADQFAIAGIGEKPILHHLMMLAVLTNSMFHDESIGERKIAVVVIKIILKKDGFAYKKSTSNKDKLIKFTTWATKTLPRDDKDRNHPDVVSLITKGKSGGLAKFTTTCIDTFGTSVSNDFGLGTAQILAHETAHTLGVQHDINFGCPDGKNIMSTSITGGKDPLRWSSCSRKQLQKFLSGPESSCLDDAPGQTVHEPDRFKILLPGRVYDGNHQCRLTYGAKYYHCKREISNCGSLFCSSNDITCQSSIAPPLDGTKCGERHWCIKGECVDDGSSMVDGGWKSWVYTTCTHPCGGGVQWKQRTCTNPIPKGGGMKCEGPTILSNSYRICNPQNCPQQSQNSRQLKCDALKPGTKAYISSSDQCTTKCKKGGLIYTLEKVPDGTRCSKDPNVKDICIQRKCRSVGCDNVFESGVKVDRCGDCNGDGTRCMLVRGVYTKKYTTWGHKKPDVMFTVPVGSTRIFVKEKVADRNVIGVQDAKGSYVIPIPSNSKTVKAAGSEVVYHNNYFNDREWIYIKGPIKEPLRLMFIYYGISNQGVFYQYYAPGKSVLTADQVSWKYSSWGACSKPCAGGQQKRTVECIHRNDKTFVNDKVCGKKDKKPDKIRKCNTSPCRPQWFVSPWKPCSKICGKGTQTRHVICREKVTQESYKAVDDHRCAGKKTSPLSKSCGLIACPPEWIPLKWGKCSKTCAGGLVTRELACRRLNENGAYMSLVAHMCRHVPRPLTQQPCNSDVLCPLHPQIDVGSTPRYKPLGCYRDGHPHAVPLYLGSLRSKIKWTNMKATVDACARLVRHRNPTYTVFGVKFYGECWSGPKALMSYREYGKSTAKHCYSGVGTHYTYYVYEYV